MKQDEMTGSWERENVNCMKGMACPACGCSDEVLVRALMWVSLTDDGTDPYADSIRHAGDVDWTDDSLARCPDCGHAGHIVAWSRPAHVAKAKVWLDENYGPDDEWPEDDWVSLDGEWDLNLYVDDDGNRRATLFPVVDGDTDIESPVEVLRTVAQK